MKHAFGHPGSDVMDFIEEMDQVGIDYVMTHHENTGAFMAAAVGRLTGMPGVVLVTKGPGVTNVATGIGSAYLDRSPLICFSSTALDVRQRVGPEFLRPITKLSEEMTAQNAAELLPKAVALSRDGTPGPVYLASDTPEQIKQMPNSDTSLEAIIATVPHRAVVPNDSAAIEDAARNLASARRLAVVVGQGVEHADALQELNEFLDDLGAPVCVTPQAVGIVSADHPLYAGMTGWHDAPIRALLPQADLVLTIGLDGADVMVPYRDLARVIHIAPTPSDVSSYQPIALAVNGDLKAVLRAMSPTVKASRDWGADIAKITRDAVDADMAVSEHHRDEDGIAPQSVIAALRAVVPADGIFTCDVGAHKIVAGTVWKSYEPMTFFISNGFGSMGYGLGTAMGAKLARPDSPVVSVIGDGGFLMYEGDVATWARLQLPIVLVVMVDNDLTQVQRRQEKAGYSIHSTTFQRVDYSGLARLHGIDAVTAKSLTDLKLATTKAITDNKPILIEAILDSEEYRRIPGWK